MLRYKNKDRQSGFNLMELMITITVGGILLAVGLPALMGLINNGRITTQTNSLVLAMHLARNEAVKRGHNIRVLPISVTTDWANGWQVRLDVDNDGTTDADDIVLRNFDAVRKATLVGTETSVTYEPTGFVQTEIDLTLNATECTSDKQRIIEVKLSGLVSSERQSCP